MNARSENVGSDLVGDRPLPVRALDAQTPSPRGPKQLSALGFLGTLLTGLPLLLLRGDDQMFAIPLLVAAVVFPSVLIISGATWMMKGVRMPEYVKVVISAAGCGAAAGLIIFPVPSFGLFGTMVTIPISMVMASIGYSLERALSRRDLFANALIIGGSFYLLACAAIEFTGVLN